MGGLLAAALVALELLLPGVVEDRVRDRLARDGGEVSVSVQSRPALRLLFGDGRRIRISGRGVSLPLPSFGDEPGDAFSRLDGFDEVDLRLTDVDAAPLRLRSVRLGRQAGSDRYTLVVGGEASAADVVDYAGGPLAGLAARLAVPATGQRHEIEAEYELVSEDGRPRVVAGGGTVGGLPTGPLGAALASAILGRL